MRIIFFGASKFAVFSLDALTAARHEIAAVVCPPDKRSGRGLKLCPVPVKESALKKGLNILEPESPNTDRGFWAKLKALNADVFAVVAYGHILSKEILDMPNIFAVNLHPSLLPKYRGAAPINWAIINGDEKTGVSVIKMTDKMDAGPVLYQEEEVIAEEDTSVSLGKRLSEKGASALKKVISLIETKKISFCKQNDKEVTFAPKLNKEDARLNFKIPAFQLHNRIRGMADWPVAFAFFAGKKIQITGSYYAHEEQSVYEASYITKITARAIHVATTEGVLLIKQVKPQGKKEMPAADFVRGYHLKEGDKFD